MEKIRHSVQLMLHFLRQTESRLNPRLFYLCIKGVELRRKEYPLLDQFVLRKLATTSRKLPPLADSRPHAMSNIAWDRPLLSPRHPKRERSDGIAECNDASLFRCPILLSGAQGEAWGLTQKATGELCSFPVAFVACFEP